MRLCKPSDLRTRKLRIFLFTLTAFFVNGALWSDDRADAEKAVDALNASANAITSFDVYLQVVTKHFQTAVLDDSKPRPKPVGTKRLDVPKVVTTHFRQSKASGKYRYDQLDGPDGRIISSVVVENGATNYYEPPRATLNVSPAGMPIVSLAGDYREMYETLYAFESIVDTFRARKSLTTAPSVDGFVTIKVDPESKSNSYFRHGTISISLDPGHGMLPAIIRSYEYPKKQAVLKQETVVNEWRKCENGAWVPIKAVTRDFVVRDTERVGELANEFTMEVDVKRSRWNTVLEDKRFALAIPAGVKVYDGLRGIDYVTGKKDPGKNLDDLVSTAKNVIRRDTADKPEPSRWHIWTISGVIVGSALLCLIAIRTIRARSR